MPDVSPLTIDLTGPEEQCWMNVLAAERQKGAPLTAVELRRIYRGADWRPKWRKKRDQV